MELEISNRQFSEAWLISSRGFSKPAIANFLCESKEGETSENLFDSVDVENAMNSRVNLSLGTVCQNGIKWDYLDPQSSLHNRNSYSPLLASDQGKTHQEELRRYFGIFTVKGGTGKTMVAAYLAGAFALLGYDVVLLDVDPEKILHSFIENENDIDASLHLAYPGRAGNMITLHLNS